MRDKPSPLTLFSYILILTRMRCKGVAEEQICSKVIQAASMGDAVTLRKLLEQHQELVLAVKFNFFQNNTLGSMSAHQRNFCTCNIVPAYHLLLLKFTSSLIRILMSTVGGVWRFCYFRYRVITRNSCIILLYALLSCKY